MARRNGLLTGTPGSLALAVMVVCIAVLVSVVAQATPYTPLDWQQQGEDRLGQPVEGRLIGWSRDSNLNFVDDFIEWIAAVEGPNKRIDIAVDFNRCVTCTEGEPGCSSGNIISFLEELGQIDYLGEVLTYAVVTDVRVGDVASIADREEVAMVEYLTPLSASLDTSVRAIRVRPSATFSPNTVEDQTNPPDGSGVTIAILDTGVDNNSPSSSGTVHNMLPAAAYVNGADCTANPAAMGDPDDQHGHGTHVAGIALGRSIACGAGATCRGVAPGASLVDIRVLDASGTSVGSSVQRGLELAIQRQQQWGIDIINMSLNGCHYQAGILTNLGDGRGLLPELINTAVANGIVVVVSAGNSGNCDANLTIPGYQAPPNNNNHIDDIAGADLAITVGNINDGNTVPLGNDSVAATSVSGPRISDGDSDSRDENKPEITAPGSSIRSAQHNTTTGIVAFTGTSMAAPHVAGAAALILERAPGMNPGSLKELLIATAAASGKPGAHPGWNTLWGYGFLDVFAALNPGAAAVSNDVGRATNACPVWMSPDISTAAPPKIGVANTMSAVVRNYDPVNAAPSVRVTFGIHRLGNVGMDDRYFDIGAATATIPAGGVHTFTINWTPPAALLEAGFPANQPVHACAKVSIDYPWDTNFANNTMQRNMDVAQASTARFPFRLVNNLDRQAVIRLIPEADPPDWEVRFLLDCEEVEPVFEMDPYRDCPKDLIVELIPPEDALPGDEGQVIVHAVTEEGEEIGGATLIGRAGAVEPDGFAILEAIYDTLLELTPEGRISPALAEAWEIDEDAKGVTFHLRSDVLFHDGQLLTADLAAESLNAPIELFPDQVREPITAYPLIEDVFPVDEFTLVIRLSQPLPGELLTLLTLPSSAIANPYEAFVGTGAFRMEEIVPNDLVVLQRFDEFWDGPVPLERLVFRIVPEESIRAMMLMTGEIDATIGVIPDFYRQLAAVGSFRMSGTPCAYQAVSYETVDEFVFRADYVLRLWEAGFLATDTLVIALPDF